MKKMMMLALAALVALLAGCKEPAAVAPALLTPIGAKTDTAIAAYGEMTDVVVYEAVVAPRHEMLYFTTDCRIGSIPVTLGQSVRAGDVVVRMDVSAVESAIAALDAQRAQLEETSAYEDALYEIDQAIGALEISKLSDDLAIFDMQTDMQLRELAHENAQTARREQISAIEAERAALRAQLENTELAAPFDGRVANLGAFAGQTVGAYDGVCVVTNDAELILQSNYIAASAFDQAVDWYALIEGARYEISPEPVDEDEYARAVLKGGSYLNTYVIADAGGLEAGQTAAIYLTTAQQAHALKLPRNALFSDGGQAYVYVMDGEARARREVQTGLLTSTEVEIVSGLAEGEVVYVAP
ncbi:MAG: efflux RND transporter periplasmic adaptor subunit [Christensenellales bacterium]|jgi:multidrug efflux pump subunit AcrA (membrane-fusion protein)